MAHHRCRGALAQRRCVLTTLAGLSVALIAIVPANSATDAAPPAGPPALAWPLPPPVSVVHAFAPPDQPWLPGQRGVDLAGQVGERVLAAADGVVQFAGRVGGVGVVSILHAPTDGVASDALRTTYEPVTASVHRGETVTQGRTIGTLALLGSQCLPAACLHWGLLRGSTYLDPTGYVASATVRLLPMPP